MPESQNVMARLRAETRDCHVATERTRLASAIARGTITLPQYVAQLQAYQSIHLILDALAQDSTDARVRAVLVEDMNKTALLASDLEALARVPRALPREPEGSLRRYITTILSDSRDGASLLGHLYVFEGSTLGSAILLPKLVASLGLSEAQSSYYRGYGDTTFAHWESFKTRMNAALADEGSQSQAVAAARRAFTGLCAVFEQIADATMAASPALEAHAPVRLAE
jgi:heme oxygenase